MKRQGSFDSDIELASDDFERELKEFDFDEDRLPPVGQPTKVSRREDNDPYQVTGFGQGGLYLHNKRKKLTIQNDARRIEDLQEGQERPVQFFDKLAVYINGFTEGLGLKQLTELLLKHGGIYVPYLDRKSLVTHIIASNLTPSKMKEFASYKVAKPAWLTESAKAGKLLDWRAFALLAAPVV
ncbi:hypothetical protein P7C70_g9438, partial [Phenoliferia sp. Uapishka_3]